MNDLLIVKREKIIVSNEFFRALISDSDKIIANSIVPKRN